MDIKTKAELTFTVTLGEGEMDLLSKVLGATMVYHEDAMDGAAEDGLISVMQTLDPSELFPVGNRIQRALNQAIEGKWISEEPL